MHAVLIHGLGRTPLSMRVLGTRLRNHGVAVDYFGYWPWREAFETIKQRLVKKLQSTIPQQAEYVLIGHSLGGILSRAVLPALEVHLPTHLVMLAPPNNSPSLARRLRTNPLFRLWAGDCGQCLGDPQFYAQLPIPTIPTTVFAGTAGPRGRLSPFGSQLNDGIVTVDETILGPDEAVTLVPSVHTFIMNSGFVFERITQLIQAL